MKRAIGLMALVVAMSATTGCTKNKKRASKLEAEIQRCRAAVQQLQSNDLTQEERDYYASVDCGACLREGGE